MLFFSRFKFDTSAQILFYVWFDYSLNHYTGNLPVKVSNYKHIMWKPHKRPLNHITYHIWNDLEDCTIPLTALTGNTVFFSSFSPSIPSTEGLFGAFSPGPSAYGFPLSLPARSKVIFDGMDNSFRPDRWDTVRDAHHSSPHQTVTDISWSIIWRGEKRSLDNLEGKQWYQNSTFNKSTNYTLIYF